MRTGTKVWLIIAASLVLLGGVVFVGVMVTLNWDFAKLSTATYETTHHAISEPYQSISIAVDTADIVFVPSENGESAVKCFELSTMKHLVRVQNGKLIIEAADTGKWYDHIGIGFQSPKITVSLPRGEYGSLLVSGDTGDVELPNAFRFENITISQSTGAVKAYASAAGTINIKTSTGAIRVENVAAGALELSVSTGDVTVAKASCAGDVKVTVSTGKTNVTDTTCKNLISDGSTGGIALNNVIAEEKFSIERSTGDVRFKDSDAAEIYVKTDTGHVTGSLLTDKVFITQTDTGRIDVPKTGTGGRCEITTDTGNIRITTPQ